MKRINIVSAVIGFLLLAVISGTGTSRAEDSMNRGTQRAGDFSPRTVEPAQEILLGVYTLDQTLADDLLGEENLLQIFIQMYLLRSSAFEAGKSLSTLPDEEKMLLAQNCLIKGNLLLVMGTAQQQEQIAEFLKKLEAACKKITAATQDVELETVVVKTPEGRKEYGVPQKSKSSPLPQMLPKMPETPPVYPKAEPYFGPAQTQPGVIPQAHPYAVPQQQMPVYHLPSQMAYNYPQANPYTQPQPHYLQPTPPTPIEQTVVIAVPFVNRKAKDFVEMLKCVEDWEHYLIFADENTNTFLMFNRADRADVNTIARIMAELFDGQKPFHEAFADLETFMGAMESVAVETFPIQHRSAEDICRFYRCMRAAASLVVLAKEPELKMAPIHHSVDESGKTLIVAMWGSNSLPRSMSAGIKNFLAMYDVPQPATPNETNKPNITALRFQNRDAAEFVRLLRNLYQAVAETENKSTPPPVLFDAQSQTVVVIITDRFFLDADNLQTMAGFYDAGAEIKYGWKNLNDFLAQNPGATAKSYPLTNYPAEPLCHLLRCLFSAVHQGTGVSMQTAFFTDETSKKLMVATTEQDEDDRNKLHQMFTKFVELCDQAEKPRPLAR